MGRSTPSNPSKKSKDCGKGLVAYGKKKEEILSALRCFIPVLPASVNSMYKRGKGGNVYLSSQAIAFNECAIPMLRLEKNRQGLQQMKGKVVVESIFYWEKKGVIDADNHLKGLHDAIQKAGIVGNDCQILPRVMDFTNRPKNCGVEVWIYEKD